MNKYLLILSIFIIAFLYSCGNSSKEVVYDLSDSSNLNIEDTIYRFDNKLAIGLNIKDSMAFIIQANSDTCLMALNIYTKKLQKSFGLVGNGPEDLISPSFMTTANGSDSIYLEDTNAKKMLTIEKRKNNEYFLKELIKYPDEIYPGSNLNYSHNFIVGRKVSTGGDKMFYIFNEHLFFPWDETEHFSRVLI